MAARRLRERVRRPALLAVAGDDRLRSTWRLRLRLVVCSLLLREARGRGASGWSQRPGRRRRRWAVGGGDLPGGTPRGFTQKSLLFIVAQKPRWSPTTKEENLARVFIVTSRMPLNLSARLGSLRAVTSLIAPAIDFFRRSDLASSVALTSLSPAAHPPGQTSSRATTPEPGHLRGLLPLQQLAISLKMHRSRAASVLKASSSRAAVSRPAAAATSIWV